MLTNSEQTTEEDNDLEKWYVYRSLHSDESWGAVIIDTGAILPNCDFLMKVFAKNEKEAIARGRNLYEKIHKFDTTIENMRRFLSATVKSTSDALIAEKGLGMLAENPNEIEIATKVAMDLAVSLNNQFEKFIKKI